MREKYGVTRIAIYGSFAKGGHAKKSDIDILVQLEKPLGLEFIELAYHLEKVLGRKVDLATFETLYRSMENPRYRHISPQILKRHWSMPRKTRKRRDKDFLGDIREAILRIGEYTAGITQERFMSDHKTQDAVIRNLEIMGKATKNLSSQLRKKYSEIPWKDLAGVRDKMIHHYFGLNDEIVWTIARE